MAGREGRVRLVGWEFEEPTPDRCSATVELEWRSQAYTGIAEEPASEAGKLRSAARATTDAVGQVLGANIATLELLDIDTVNAFGTPAVIVALAMHIQENRHTQENEYFVGFCVVEDELAIAAVRSVLSATNRLIQRLEDTI
jgi:hypothetical protein